MCHLFTTLGRFQVWYILECASEKELFFGGGCNIGSTYAEGGSQIAYRVSTRGEGGKKRPKNCVRTMYTFPYPKSYSNLGIFVPFFIN